jgi:hypothetical protein
VLSATGQPSLQEIAQLFAITAVENLKPGRGLMARCIFGNWTSAAQIVLSINTVNNWSDLNLTFSCTPFLQYEHTLQLTDS